jgi:hypothetical protein
VSAEQETFPYVVKRYEPNRLMAASDFPHGLGGSGETAMDQVLANPRLSQHEKDRILGLNVAELFGIAADQR